MIGQLVDLLAPRGGGVVCAQADVTDPPQRAACAAGEGQDRRAPIFGQADCLEDIRALPAGRDRPQQILRVHQGLHLPDK